MGRDATSKEYKVRPQSSRFHFSVIWRAVIARPHLEVDNPSLNSFKLKEEKKNPPHLASPLPHTKRKSSELRRESMAWHGMAKLAPIY